MKAQPKYFVKTPGIIRMLSGKSVWEVPASGNTIYLTYDDGPDPEITPNLLDLLQSHNAKATFFCTGKKAGDHPELLAGIRAMGHSIGNHTYSHLNGWKTSAGDYMDDVDKAEEILKTTLFRPPFGRITRKQAALLRVRYKIIMWTVMPGDFDSGKTKEKVAERAIRHTQSASIIVFHDNSKSGEKALYATEQVLIHFSEKGYRFSNLEDLTG